MQDQIFFQARRTKNEIPDKHSKGFSEGEEDLMKSKNGFNVFGLSIPN